MKKLFVHITFITLLLSCNAFSGSPIKQEQNLYLVVEQEKVHKYEFKAVIPETLEERMENRYVFRKIRLYDGYPLEFLSKDRRKAKNLNYRELKKIPVVTIEQLQKFISEQYTGSQDWGYLGGDYFRNLKHIYLVEKDDKTKTATITEVKIDITIE